MKRILMVFGTRPEIIKLGPVHCELQANGKFQVDVYWSGQHVELAAGLLELFGIAVTHHGRRASAGVGLAGKMGLVLEDLDALLARRTYDWIVVQGDTATAAAAAMAGFLGRVPVAHVEAGLRTQTLDSPWPEEFNRRAVALCTTLHFAPTRSACRNLLDEGYPPERVLVTGNTVVDALLQVRRRLGPDYLPVSRSLHQLDRKRKLVLVTGHRRENFGAPLREMFRALRQLAADGDKCMVFPVHLNPNVQELARAELAGTEGIHLVEPLQYPDFVYLLDRAFAVVTDSGGIQEEAPTFGKPVVITRESTERPEVVWAGFGHLVGCDAARIVERVRAFTSGDEPVRLPGHNPFGRGDAARHIVSALSRHPESLAEDLFTAA